MQITLQSTDEIVEVDDGVSARIWVGATASGIPVRAIVVGVSPQTNDPVALDEFERELQQREPPASAVAAALNPLRYLLDQYDAEADLGPCCICETTAGVTNIVWLDRRCAVPGHGWGCVVCHLPPDGAVAVLCDACHELYRQQPEYLFTACRGYPGTEGRISIEELPLDLFKHDPDVHHG